MTFPALILASETRAAKLLDLTLPEFRALVEGGHLPKGREIAPGVIRWSVQDLSRIVNGEAADGLGDIQW